MVATIDFETERIVKVQPQLGWPFEIESNQQLPYYREIEAAWTTYRKAHEDEEWHKEAALPVALNPNLNEPRLIQYPGDGSTSDQGCRNMSRRERLLPGPIALGTEVKRAGWPVINSIAGICAAAEVYICDNEECVQQRKGLEPIAPKCDWTAYRNWFIQVIACQRVLLLAEQTTESFFHLTSAIDAKCWLFDKLRRQNLKVDGNYLTTENEMGYTDLFSVCELIHWGLVIQEYIGAGAGSFEPWGENMVPHEVAAKPIMATLQGNTICPNRLWNLSAISERGEHDLPIISDLAGRHPQLEHVGHSSCRAGLCAYASIDATRLKQLHVCDSQVECEKSEVHFDQKLLRTSIENGGGSAWSINEPFEISEKQYIAISHVWSDGTGIGLREPGRVNRCLFNYFAGIVKSIGYDAIWWDTISIPTNPALRRRAINKMHTNYSRSRSLALLLFFRHGLHEVGRPWSARRLVDLDDDILAKDPVGVHPAYWIASRIIRRIRKAGQLDNVSDLLAILKPRHTSWPRDRIVIAGLLAGIEVDYQMSEASITQAVFQKFKRISFSGLVHSEQTITEAGGWSWCPHHLYDLTPSPHSEFDNGKMFFKSDFFVDKEGSLGGTVDARAVTKEDIQKRRIIAVSSQASVTFKIRTALLEWRNCLLLGTYPGPFILVSIEERNENTTIKYFNKLASFPQKGQPWEVIFGRPTIVSFWKIILGSETNTNEAIL
ncbi:hypothetical protein ABW20_dc0105803 [Dactylellina cionopaga]|nr:hypothetical protein ABW20_dc0105803 [Dactylellina cionopaga]